MTIEPVAALSLNQGNGAISATNSLADAPRAPNSKVKRSMAKF